MLRAQHPAAPSAHSLQQRKGSPSQPSLRLALRAQRAYDDSRSSVPPHAALRAKALPPPPAAAASGGDTRQLSVLSDTRLGGVGVSLAIWPGGGAVAAASSAASAAPLSPVASPVAPPSISPLLRAAQAAPSREARGAGVRFAKVSANSTC